MKMKKNNANTFNICLMNQLFTLFKLSGTA